MSFLRQQLGEVGAQVPRVEESPVLTCLLHCGRRTGSMGSQQSVSRRVLAVDELHNVGPVAVLAQNLRT